MLEIYEKSVAELKNDMINLGIKVEQAVDNAWKALEQKDIELAFTMAMTSSMNWSRTA